MASPLADLDELVLKCRDDRAKAYIAEAVASYKVGALRAAIVATWIAVCFDVIEKLRELALAGDKEAELRVEELEVTRKSNDIVKALAFERELLTLIRDKFELISHIEFVDLERLQFDRNRCAHPSLVSEDQAYSPSAELARAHIHAAVTHLLCHPPAQGKYALERLVREVKSQYFPVEINKARIALATGPLKRPRESLVRNFVLVLIKQFFEDISEIGGLSRYTAALGAVRGMHPAAFQTTLQAKLPALFRSVEDDSLIKSITFLERVPDCWQYLDVDIRMRLQKFVESLPKAHMDEIEDLLKHAHFKVQAEKRVRFAPLDDFEGAHFFFQLPEVVAKRLIELVVTARSQSHANRAVSRLAQESSDLTAVDTKNLLERIQTNRFVMQSGELSNLISRLRKTKTLSIEEFDSLLTSNGLQNYLPSKSGFDDMDDDIPF